MFLLDISRAAFLTVFYIAVLPYLVMWDILRFTLKILAEIAKSKS